MGKPEWLVENERKKRKRQPNVCGNCMFKGSLFKYIRRRKGEKKIALYECKIHPNCFNTDETICCKDWRCV